jgi:hypothetical protein
MLERWLDQERIALCSEVEIFGELALDKEGGVALHLQQIVLALPNKRDVLELVDAVSLVVQRVSIGRGGDQVAQDKLPPPFDYALYSMQAEHPERMQDSHRLINQLLIDPLIFLECPIELFNLLNATFPGNNGSYSLLDGCTLIFQVLNLFSEDWQILRWGKPINAVEEDCTVVVWDQEPVPCLQKLLF